jgi:hypothetical protein
VLCDVYCKLTSKPIPEDLDITQCEHYEQARTCMNCTYGIATVYETGTIDDIEYRCSLQNKKLMYDDSNPYYRHYADVPECNINKFKENKQ